MAKSKQTKKALLSSVIALILCFSMLLGTTFAWFTDEVASAKNQIVAGNLDIELYYQNDEITTWNKVGTDTNVFKENTYWEPGHTEVVYLKIVNKGTLALKYQLSVNVAAEKSSINVYDKEFKLSSFIQYAAVRGQEPRFADRDAARDSFEVSAPLIKPYIQKDILLDAGEETYVALIVYMPEETGNDANYKKGAPVPTINLGINLLATQYTEENDSFGNDYDAEATFWDAQADTSWYNAEAETFALTTPQQLAGLAKLVNDGTDSFINKTVTLDADIDLSGHQFIPIGGFDKGHAFEGTFDGGGHMISNMNVNGWDQGYYYGQQAGMGLFGVVYDATVRNVEIDSAEIAMEAVVMGVVAGYAGGNCTFEGITVSNSQIANYNWDTGGIVGQAYGGHQVYKDITIDSTNTISGHWGTWDVSAGGVIGRTANGMTVEMENVYVAAKLDVYNDAVAAYQWFAYRYSGMLVGYTKTTEKIDGRTVATAPHVTCKDVTVVYGDWMNYTYCQFGNVAPQYVREQGGYSTDPYYSGRHWTPAVDLNGNKVVSVEHEHAAGEAHRELLPFDQLFGGGQGVYGTATHPGVTVIYPADKETIQGAFEVDDGSGNKSDIKKKINIVIFGKTSEYPEIVSGYTPISNEKGVATYQVPNGEKYDIYYLSENKIMLPENSKNLFQDLTNVTEIDGTNLDMSQVENALCMFANCNNLKTIKGLEDWDMSNVTNMQSMFYGCNKLEDIDVSQWDTSNVTNMRMVFFRCYALSNDDLKGVENWDVSNVTNFYSMFKHARGLTSLDLSAWDTSSATTMSHMFANIGGVQELDLSGFDTSNVTDMSWMFYDASKLTTVYVGDGWTTEAVDPSTAKPFYNNQTLVGGNGTTWLDVCEMANPARPWESSAALKYAVVDGTDGNPGLLTYKAN